MYKFVFLSSSYHKRRRIFDVSVFIRLVVIAISNIVAGVLLITNTLIMRNIGSIVTIIIVIIIGVVVFDIFVVVFVVVVVVVLIVIVVILIVDDIVVYAGMMPVVVTIAKFHRRATGRQCFMVNFNTLPKYVI